MKTPPLIVHLIYRLDFGGLETLLVECVNRMPVDRYRHAIVCLTDYTEFSRKISRPDVQVYALHKKPGLGLRTHGEVWKLLRRLRPAILHTYNLAAIEYSLAAALAGVPVRIHAEHGRDAADPEGRNRKHNFLRRVLIPFVDRYVPVSADLQRWLKTRIGVPDRKNQLIHNGVDTERFHPPAAGKSFASGLPFHADDVVIGTVGRVQDVKNHLGLIDAFVLLRERLPSMKGRLRLAIVGDGPLLDALRRKAADAGIADFVWLPGARSDIADIMRGFSVFALSSIAEGTPVTILEAMATGLPVVATRVGGIPEAVAENSSGLLVPPSDPSALAAALARYCEDPELARRHGRAGRERVERQGSIAAMIAAYAGLYDTLCQTKIKTREAYGSCVE